jgi:hypothetical protein
MSKARDLADIIPSLIVVSSQAYLQFEQDISFSSSAPLTASVGTLWTDTTDPATPVLKVYNGSTWIVMSGAGGDGGINPFFTAGI